MRYIMWLRIIVSAPDPSELYRTNDQGTVALFRAAAEAGVARMIYTVVSRHWEFIRTGRRPMKIHRSPEAIWSGITSGRNSTQKNR